jgi:hypothetical protein
VGDAEHMGKIKSAYEMSARKTRCRWKDSIRMEYQRNRKRNDVLNSTDSGEGPMENFYEQDSKVHWHIIDSIRVGNFLTC